MINWQGFIEVILNSDFIQNMILLIIRVLMVLVNLVLFPIGALLAGVMPPLDEGLSAIASYFEYAGTYAGYVLDLLLVPLAPIAFIGVFWTVTASTGLVLWVVKLALSWKKSLFT